MAGIYDPPSGNRLVLHAQDASRREYVVTKFQNLTISDPNQLTAAVREQAAGAREWFVSRDDGLVAASIVREVPPRKPDSTDVPAYRLRMVCNASTGVGEMQLTWSPQPQTGRTMIAWVDGNSRPGC